MIGGLEEDDPYVWADNGKGKLEKRKITLGQYDEELFEYEIADGLSEEDMITYPEEGLEEGMSTAPGENGQMGQSNPQMMEDGMEGEIIDDGMMDNSMMEDGMMDDGMIEEGMVGEEMPADGMMEEESGAVDGETEDEQ